MSSAEPRTGPSSSPPPQTSTSPRESERKAGSLLPVILSALALVLAGSAVGLSFTTGHTGPGGVPGPGAVVNQSIVRSTTTVTNTCVNVTGGQVTLRVSGPGTIVVTVAATVSISHQTTAAINYSDVVLNVASSTSDCSSDPSAAFVPGLSPIAPYSIVVNLERSFAVATAGTYTFYLDCQNQSNDPGTNSVGPVSMVGVYYPS